MTILSGSVRGGDHVAQAIEHSWDLRHAQCAVRRRRSDDSVARHCGAIAGKLDLDVDRFRVGLRLLPTI